MRSSALCSASLPQPERLAGRESGGGVWDTSGRMSAPTGTGQARERPRIERFIAQISPSRAIGLVIAVAVGMTVLGAVVRRLVNPSGLPSCWDSPWLAVITVTPVGFCDGDRANASGRVVARV